MNDQQVAQELVRRGIISAQELQSSSLGEILVRRGIIGPEELTQGLTIFEVLRKRGII